MCMNRSMVMWSRRRPGIGLGMNARRHLAVRIVFCAVALGGLGAWDDTQQDSLERELLTAPPVMAFATAERLLKVHIVSDEQLKPALDRRAFLQTLVNRIAAGATTDQERVERWTEWLQNHMAHSVKPPLDTDGQAVYDPIWLLRSRVAHCGQTNRVLVDGLDAVGYKTRLVQFVGHVGAEVYFGGGWRYIDADIFDFGTFVRKEDGSLASGEEITANPELIDVINPLEEARLYPPVGRPHPPLDVAASRALIKEQFTKRVFHDGAFVTPYVWVKTATREQEGNKYYGWNYYHAEKGW